MLLLRVNKDYPCPICGKPDWCLVSDNGQWAICPRTPQGAVRQLSCGYLHRLVDGKSFVPRPKLISAPKPAPLNWQRLAKLYQEKLDRDRRQRLAENLGLQVETLRIFGVGWDGDEAYTIPLWANGEVVGILRRYEDGRKWLVRGSLGGLYHRVDGYWLNGHLLICEGLTDTMVAVEAGYEAIGRYNCLSNRDEIVGILRGTKTTALIIADNDPAGVQGAEGLMQALLRANVRTLRLVVPSPYNDLREWYQKAGKEEMCRLIGMFIGRNKNGV